MLNKKITPTFEEALQMVRADASLLVATDSRWAIDESKLELLQQELATATPLKSQILYNDLATVNEKLAFVLYYAATTFSYVNPVTGSEYAYTFKGEKRYRTNGYVTALLQAPVQWDKPSTILALSDEDWRQVFQLEKSDLYLAEQRIAALRQLARAYIDESIYGLDVDGVQVDELFSSLMSTGLFEDRFLKRIQMGFAFLYGVTKMHGLRYTGNVQLTAMADYRLPQVFINTSVLVVDDELISKLTHGKLFEKNSPDELLMRAYAIEICRLLSKAMHTTEADVDTQVWSYAQRMLAKESFPIPAPRVVTDCY